MNSLGLAAPKSTPATLGKIFLCFLLGGFLFQVIVQAMYLCVELLWVDFININPHRPRSNALAMMLLSPIYGLALVIYFKVFTIVAGAATAIMLRVIFGDISYWGMLVIFFVFSAAANFSLSTEIMQSEFVVGADLPDAKGWTWIIFRETSFQFFVSVGCWLCLRRTWRRASPG